MQIHPQTTVPDAAALYRAVGWHRYADDPALLERAIAGSTWVATERRDDGALLGLIRVVSDDASIAYVQDLLVHPDAQRQGVGRALLHAAMARFEHCRQHVLLTDDRPEQTAFYESLGWTRLDKATTATLRCFACMPGLG